MLLTLVVIYLIQFTNAVNCTERPTLKHDSETVKIHVGQESSFYIVPNYYTNTKLCGVTHTVIIMFDGEHSIISFDD